MINIQQFIQIILRPTLQQIPKGYSKEAELLLLVVAAHESKGGHYIKQVKGPAMGMFQIEPLTHFNTWELGDSCQKNAQLLDIDRDLNKLTYDLRYQVFVARQRLFMKIDAIPTDLDDICQYAKDHWNTVHGKATAADYKNDYLLWVKN